MAKKPAPIAFSNPVNSNARLDAKHSIYVAGTGGGKTSAIFHMPTIPKSAQVVIFDPYTGYAGKKLKGQMVHGTSSRHAFAKGLYMARRNGQPFKLAYIPKGGACAEELEFFAGCVWSMGNGNAPELHTVIEELASCVEAVGKLKGKAGELLRGGRQFGIVVHSLFQKAQEVPKTVTDQSDTWWVGKLQSSRDIEWVAHQREIPISELSKLISAKQNMQRINKPIAEYLLITDFGQYKKGAFNCHTGAQVSLNYR
ncbi:hypothetical protein ACRZ5S_14605 [Vibrio scophthalmi]|uniref:Helicase HerA central domain-containing protein n=1 Tax=Vibrio scophthalmi TaxID=45658 RepID=A0A1E3WK16_9VIBR|nr:hypothetical protein [Vibrio scophthalmi]ODS09814.1 hypothetical protein VSF3289_00045 [Vibrio scophthalmi]ODS10088.1 hypothetical protein VSF3289_00326 [Vibrio scophthalmi]